MDKLRENLMNFQQLTASLINSLKQEDYDSLESILNKREEIIRDIRGLNYISEDFKSISSELRIMQLENVLNKLLSEKKQSARDQIDKLKVVKRANNNYQRSFQPDSIFFSKKI